MSYIVVYQRADGSSGLEECGTLDLAVVAAERLRNVDSVEHPRIFKTEEVKFDFRPYYRVEVFDGAESPTTSETSEPVSTASTISAPVVESDSPPPPTPISEPAASTATIDPWASTEAASADADSDEPEPIDYTDTSTIAETDQDDISSAPSAESATATDDDFENMVHADASRGLFSTASLPEPPMDGADIDKLAEDVNDAVPPRRGLFGR